jgi:cation diffusion facilitator family transporter
MSHSAHSPSSAIRWAAGALVVSVALAVTKLVAWRVTGSAALMSDALESLINIVTSSFSLYAVWLSAQPRDADHPYGHGKVEYLAASVEGALIAAAGTTILIVAVPRLWLPAQLHALDVGLWASATIALAALVSGELIARAGRRLESLTVESDGLHLRSDGLTTSGAFVSLLVVHFTGWIWLDAATACVMAVWLGVSGVGIVRRAVGGLMDEAVPDLLEVIAGRLEELRQPGWLTPHHTKVHRHGQYVHIDMHLVLPRFWTLEQAHEVSLHVEQALRDEFSARSDIMTHLEPCRPSACSECDMSECPVRSAPFTSRPAWTGASIRLPMRDAQVPSRALPAHDPKG